MLLQQAQHVCEHDAFTTVVYDIIHSVLRCVVIAGDMAYDLLFL